MRIWGPLVQVVTRAAGMDLKLGARPCWFLGWGVEQPAERWEKQRENTAILQVFDILIGTYLIYSYLSGVTYVYLLCAKSEAINHPQFDRKGGCNCRFIYGSPLFWGNRTATVFAIRVRQNPVVHHQFPHSTAIIFSFNSPKLGVSSF